MVGTKGNILYLYIELYHTWRPGAEVTGSIASTKDLTLPPQKKGQNHELYKIIRSPFLVIQRKSLHLIHNKQHGNPARRGDLKENLDSNCMKKEVHQESWGIN